MKSNWPNWGKSLARNLRDGGWKSAFAFLRERRIFRLIRNIPLTWPKSSSQVHVLVSHDRIPMMLWMAASLMVSTRSRFLFVLHDDGTFYKKDIAVLEDCLPGCRIVASSYADECMLNRLQAFPLLANYRARHAFGKRLTDFTHFCEADKLISIDSDILFFRNPVLFLELAKEQNNASVFLRDVEDASLIKPGLFADRTGRELANPLNAGMFATPNAFMEFGTMEKILREFALLEQSNANWFIEQTVLGALASMKGLVSLLPSSYEQTFSRRMQEDCVMRHYVGKVRHLFYSEGLPKVAENLRQLKREHYI